MSETFDIQEYMTEGVRRIVKDALKATLKDPRGSAFMVKFAAASARADAISIAPAAIPEPTTPQPTKPLCAS